MNPLKKAICEERGVKSKDAWAATTCWFLLSLPLPFSPLSSLSLNPRPNHEGTEYSMILDVGWHGASRPVVVVVRLDARFYEREEDSKLGYTLAL
jgi:hypothetical protein